MMKDVSWKEAAEACNNIFTKYHNSNVKGYVGDCCMNALPQAITQMLATTQAEGLTHEDVDVAILVNAYKQLTNKGFVGAGAENKGMES